MIIDIYNYRQAMNEIANVTGFNKCTAVNVPPY